MRIGIDYTSAITQGAGIGRYTRELVAAIPVSYTHLDVYKRQDHDPSLFPYSLWCCDSVFNM